MGSSLEFRVRVSPINYVYKSNKKGPCIYLKNNMF